MSWGIPDSVLFAWPRVNRAVPPVAQHVPTRIFRSRLMPRSRLRPAIRSSAVQSGLPWVFSTSHQLSSW
jgi:hypothetical protein